VVTIAGSSTVMRRADDRQTDNYLHASILPLHFTIKRSFQPEARRSNLFGFLNPESSRPRDGTSQESRALRLWAIVSTKQRSSARTGSMSRKRILR
jgi:hypothetical protein